MGLIGSDTRLLVVTWSKLPAERPVSRLSRPVVQLSLVRAPAQPPQHAYSGGDPTPRPAAVYASNAALPRRPQDSLPSCSLGFGRTRLALASSHQLLLSHPASGFPTGFIARQGALGIGVGGDYKQVPADQPRRSQFQCRSKRAVA